MRKTTLFVFFLYCVNFTFAQQFKVESFKMITSNITSNQNVQKDNNGTPCALLRVIIAETNLKFSGYIVGDILYDGNSYLLNLANGAKKLSIVKQGVMPFSFIIADYTTEFRTLKSGCQYELNLSLEVKNKERSGQINGHDYVDMGTSVKWATMNVDANRIEELGEKYVYGRIEPYKESFFELQDEEFQSRVLNDMHNYRLPSNADVAFAKFGKGWRSPTSWDFKELKDKCQSSWIVKNGVLGIQFVAKNGNKLFLPSSTIFDDGHKVIECRYCGNFKEVKLNISSFWWYGSPPDYGIEAGYVRPVSDLYLDVEEWQFLYSMKPDGYINTHPYVDLGLSVKWATCNIDASNDTQTGNTYSWGETSSKKYDEYYDSILGNHEFYSNSYKLGNDSQTDKVYGISGSKTIRRNDDVAHVRWGTSWRYPSKNEMDELKSKCTWTWTYNYKNKGVRGYIVRSNVEGYKDKSIFLPVSEYGSARYWSGTIYNNTSDPYPKYSTMSAFCTKIDMYNYDKKQDGEDQTEDRCIPCFIRPVCN